MKNLSKAVESDKRRLLADGVESYFTAAADERVFSYLCDYDEQYVYFETYYEDEQYTWKASYILEEGKLPSFGDVVAQVVRATEYTEIDNEYLDKDLLKAMSDLCKSNNMSMKPENALLKVINKIGNTFKSKQENTTQIVKQFNEDEMVAIEPLYISIGDVDGVGDTYASAEVCYEMVESFNKAIADGKMKGNYFHKVMTDDFTAVKAWVNEHDCMIGDTEVKEGMPLVKVKYNNAKAWELRKSNDFMGHSIGAIATWEEV